MTPGRLGNVGGATLGDMLVFLAILSLAAALLYPRVSRRAFEDRLERAIEDVETLSSAARATHARSGSWPSSAPPGEIPRDLAGLSPSDSIFARVDYTLGWRRWEVIDSMIAPQPPALEPVDPRDPVGPSMAPVVKFFGGIDVYSAEEVLLAELFEHYGRQTSFVRDTMWTLILPERSR